MFFLFSNFDFVFGFLFYSYFSSVLVFINFLFFVLGYFVVVVVFGFQRSLGDCISSIGVLRIVFSVARETDFYFAGEGTRSSSSGQLGRCVPF